jgi:hypothetical protein
MTADGQIKLSLSEEEFRLLNDLVDVAGQMVDGGHLKRTVNCSYDVKVKLGSKLRNAGKASNLEAIYGPGIFWFRQGFRSKSQSIDVEMTDDTQKLDALNRDYSADIRESMFYVLALEQAKCECFEAFKKDYSSGQDIDNYVDWHQHQDTAGMDMPLLWSRTHLHRYLDEYKKNGILNLKFKLWTRFKMFFWLPPRN